MKRIPWRGLRVTLLVPLLAIPTAASAAQAPDSVTLVAGERYAASGLHRWLLGSGYRVLWTEPVRVAVLDLDTFAGGLTPTERGGGMQTRSLRFVSPDGREWAFRSVDKDPSSILPPVLRETLVDDVVQDQISAGHPVGALVTDRLLDAVGVLHPEPQLFVMPDDPRLGEFREEFAGMLGAIEIRPNEGSEGERGFMGATLVIGTDRLLERIEEDLERIDERAFLAARLVDAFIGDWDRHRDQWRWARFGETRDSLWRPVARDRDQAFVKLDGLLLTLARQYFPQLVRFGPEYPSTLGLTWNGRELDRRFLVGLEWPAWDSVAASLQASLTDAVIDSAVAALPPEYAESNAEWLAHALRSRRDGLRTFARRFYELLAGVVEVHTTDAPETASLERLPGGRVHVVVRARTTDGLLPIYDRTLDPGDTDEFRLDLHGGADSARVTGPRAGGITLRVMGGGGDDVLIDESGGARFYDTSGDNTYVRGPGTRVDERRYDYRGPDYVPSQPPRDWGTMYRFPLWFSYSPDVGLLAGMTVERFGYGFRSWPYRSRVRVRAAFGTTASAFRGGLEAEIYRRNSGVRWTFSARGSGLEVLRFHGFGNETADDEPEDRYEVEQSEFAIESRIVFPVGNGRSQFSVGPMARLTETGENAGRLISEVEPYGSGTFRQVGLYGDLDLDNRDHVKGATRGTWLHLGAAVHPGLLDVESAYTTFQGTAATYLTAPMPLRPTLALRLGGRKLWGDYPYADAAFLGDDETVRLSAKQRYAGDAEVHANAELRLRLARAVIVLPADFGVFGLYDTGRVWLDGESSDRWHDAAGGGIWLAFLQPENTLSLAVASAEGRTGIYVSAGFAF